MSNKQPQVMQSSNSLVVGLSVYQYLCRQSKPVPAKAIAIDTGLHIRKVQRILKVLADLNFINRSSADRNTYLYTARIIVSKQLPYSPHPPPNEVDDAQVKKTRIERVFILGKII